MTETQWKTLGKLIGSLVAAGVLAAGVLMPLVLGSGLVAKKEANRFLDTPCNLQESAPPQKTTLYARDGKTLLATLFSQDRQPVALSKVPTYLQQALVATEDRRFYQHHGVDLRGLVRGAVSTSGGDTQGGSTLTMQYVKQIRYFQAGDNQAKQQAAIVQNLQRKIEDAKCALYFENTKHESKAQILDNYLNIAFFGENSYGIETAAQTYFGVPVDRLTLAQSALLVGLLRAPSSYDPFTNPTAAKARRDEVIQNLVSVGKLSQTAANEQKQAPISLATKKPPVVEQGCASANPAIKNVAFFCEYARNWLSGVNGIDRQQQDTGGYKIVTTLDPKVQNSAQQHMNDVVSSTGSSTAVLPTVDPKTGDVLAMASSKTFGSGKGQTEQPIFTANTASGASTYKLFPLLLALQTGISPDQSLETVGNSGTYKANGCATPGGAVNGDANVSYNDVETLTSAAQKSDNTYFVALAEKMFACQLQPMVDLMHSLGMTGIDTKSDVAADRGASIGKVIVDNQRAQQLVLGSVPTSPLQLAAAYAAVANKGVYNAPSPIRSITDANGDDVPLKRTKGTQVLQPQVAAQAVNILIGDTKDFGTSADAFGDDWYGDNSSDIAGKTGTADLSQKQYKGKNGAIWFVGMTPNLVATSGIINFDSPSTPNSGIKGMKSGEAYGSTAARVWIDALHGSLVKRSWTWPDPDSVNGVDVPSLEGDSVSDAKAALAPLGLKLSILGQRDGLYCDASAAYETIGFAGPSKALPGSTVTACLSTSTPAYTPPVIVTPPNNGGNDNGDRNSGNSRTRNRGNGGGSGNGSGNGSGSGNGGGSGSGGGNSGGGSGGGNGGGSGNGGGNGGGRGRGR